MPGLRVERTTALGNIEAPPPAGWEHAEDIAVDVRRGLMGHCVGARRGRSCPDWYILTVLDKLEVWRSPEGALTARVATMIPRPSGDDLAWNICKAVRYELFRVTTSAVAEVFVYQWDGVTTISRSVGGQPCR